MRRLLRKRERRRWRLRWPALVLCLALATAGWVHAAGVHAGHASHGASLADDCHRSGDREAPADGPMDGAMDGSAAGNTCSFAAGCPFCLPVGAVLPAVGATETLPAGFDRKETSGRDPPPLRHPPKPFIRF